MHMNCTKLLAVGVMHFKVTKCSFSAFARATDEVLSLCNKSCRTVGMLLVFLHYCRNKTYLLKLDC